MPANWGADALKRHRTLDGEDQIPMDLQSLTGTVLAPLFYFRYERLRTGAGDANSVHSSSNVHVGRSVPPVIVIGPHAGLSGIGEQCKVCGCIEKHRHGSTHVRPRGNCCSQSQSSAAYWFAGKRVARIQCAREQARPLVADGAEQRMLHYETSRTITRDWCSWEYSPSWPQDWCTRVFDPMH